MCLPSETDLCKYQHEPKCPRIDRERTRQAGEGGRLKWHSHINYTKEQGVSLRKKKSIFYTGENVGVVCFGFYCEKNCDLCFMTDSRYDQVNNSGPCSSAGKFLGG